MKDKAPRGGWLGPPGNTDGLAPIATAVGSKNGKWKWKAEKLSPKQEKKHRKFNKAMKVADSKGEWGFSWK